MEHVNEHVADAHADGLQRKLDKQGYAACGRTQCSCDARHNGAHHKTDDVCGEQLQHGEVENSLAHLQGKRLHFGPRPAPLRPNHRGFDVGAGEEAHPFGHDLKLLFICHCASVRLQGLDGFRCLRVNVFEKVSGILSEILPGFLKVGLVWHDDVKQRPVHIVNEPLPHFVKAARHKGVCGPSRHNRVCSRARENRIPVSIGNLQIGYLQDTTNRESDANDVDDGVSYKPKNVFCHLLGKYL
mmetsp:Transcript_43123/g.108914  ORF Transcript_43123/g.108914 Transcript_43123/m.108914 type:complete len:242 (-) Transcript_43123:2989-3714(-)